MANLLLTEKCVRACPYCFAKEYLKESKAKMLSWENLIYIADLFESSNEKKLSLLGGEPTLHPEFVDFVLYLNQRKFHVNVFTSGIMPAKKLNTAKEYLLKISEENLSFVCNYNHPNTSTDSETKQINAFFKTFSKYISLSFNLYQNDSIINERDNKIPDELPYTVDSTILNYRYAYDNKGLMSSRSESVLNVLETYTYDNLDRLTSVTTGKIGQTGTTQTFSYHGNGNIENNSDVGDFYYGTNMSPPKPHAVTQIAPISERAISANQCAVTYNFFNQPTQITEGSYQFDLSYGANQQRNKVERSKNNVIENTRYYYSKYLEKEVDATAGTKHYYYIYGDNGVVGLYIDPRSVGTDTLYYIHTDHLGSYCAITTANVQAWMGEIENACGWQCRQAVRTWSCGGISADLIFCFFLIKQKEEEENMNGRLYDPVIARFFSPDKFVANSSFTQDFNRYSYARNCPLMYTDPDGEFFFLFPYVNWSKESGLNFGLNCIVGIPGIASAQFSVGVGPQTGLTATLGVTAAFTTAYVSIGTQSGLNVGWSFGLSPQIGLPFSSNITSFGINYNFKHGVLSGNLSAFCFDSNGKTSFNPSFSAAIAPEHFTNLVKGGGFRSNEQVFNRMMDRNSCQEILDYFGFKGKYDPEHALFKKWGLDHGITDPKTGKIYYSDGAFSKNYDYLALVAHHELFHSRNVKSGKFNGNYALEDWNTYMANYENQGLYPSQSSEIIRRIEGTGFASGIYGIGTEGYTNFSLQWWHFIYRIPRLW